MEPKTVSQCMCGPTHDHLGGSVAARDGSHIFTAAYRRQVVDQLGRSKRSEFIDLCCDGQLRTYLLLVLRAHYGQQTPSDPFRDGRCYGVTDGVVP